ncbi:hypothetical protein ACSSS7_006831 [Eimeria intestinalis]
MTEVNISYLSSSEAQQIDAELMGPSVKYRIEQLMELAGLSVARALTDFSKTLKTQTPGFLVLVIHLKTPRAWDLGSFRVCTAAGPPASGERARGADLRGLADRTFQAGFKVCDVSPYSVLVDALFGFSFRGPLRAPYLGLIQKAKATGLPVFSVDVPSGCNVDSRLYGSRA